MFEYPEFTKGQRVRSVTGEAFTVTGQIGCMVYVAGRSGWFHPTKLHAI